MKPIPYLSSLPGCGSGMLMTLSASSGRAQPKNSYTISIGRRQADHQVHCGAGRRRGTPVPQHVTQKERGWKPRQLYLQEAMHTDGYLHFESQSLSARAYASIAFELTLAPTMLCIHLELATYYCSEKCIPYSGKIWRALNLAKWRKKAVF